MKALLLCINFLISNAAFAEQRGSILLDNVKNTIALKNEKYQFNLIPKSLLINTKEKSDQQTTLLGYPRELFNQRRI